MINVSKVYEVEFNNSIKYCCDYVRNGDKKTLWFEISKESKPFVSMDICDPFFVILTLFAIEVGENIEFSVPVSRKLLFGFKEYLMDALSSMDLKYKLIEVNANPSDITFDNSPFTATAMSMGVDSFYSLYSNIHTEFPITHLTLFNAGTFGSKDEEGAKKLFEQMVNQVSYVSEVLGYPLIWVDTNINEVLTISFLRSHSFRHLACALLLQKGIGTYFYSSGHKIEDFKLDISDSANYDLLSTYSLSSNNMNLNVSGLTTTRVHKTISLTNFKPTESYLNVCLITTDYDSVEYKSGSYKNCSKCHKCIRTMLTLDVIGKLNNYKDIFDIDLYKKNKDKHMSEMIYHFFKSKDPFSVEILDEMKKRNVKLNVNVYINLIKRCFKPIFSKIRLNKDV